MSNLDNISGNYHVAIHLNSLNVKIYDHTTDFVHVLKFTIFGSHLGHHLENASVQAAHFGILQALFYFCYRLIIYVALIVTPYKVSVTDSKLSVYLHYVVLCFTNANVKYPLEYCYGI